MIQAEANEPIRDSSCQMSLRAPLSGGAADGAACSWLDAPSSEGSGLV